VSWTSIASIVTCFPVDVTTSCNVPFVAFEKDAIEIVRIADEPASDSFLIALPFHLTWIVPHDEHVAATMATERVTTPVRVNVAPRVVVVDSVPPKAVREPVCTNPESDNDRSSSGVVVQRSGDQFETLPAWSRARTEKQTVRPALDVNVLLPAVVADFHVEYPPKPAFHGAVRERTSYDAIPDSASVAAHATANLVEGAVLWAETGVAMCTALGAVRSAGASVVVDVLRSAVSAGAGPGEVAGSVAAREAGTRPDVTAATAATNAAPQLRTGKKYARSVGCVESA